MTTKDKEQYGWYGVELPNRPTQYTYYFWPEEKIPKIKIKEEFQDITTLSKLQSYLDRANPSSPLFNSPTDCFFDVGRKSLCKAERTAVDDNVFFLDSQDCLVWYLDEKGRVRADSHIIVARSLPEFLTRIELENSIWYKTCRNKPLTELEESYIQNVSNTK